MQLNLKLKILIFFILNIISLNINAFELVVIQSVSTSRKSFVTRTGKKVGNRVGQRATFTTPSLSLVAKASSVTRQYTVWEVQEQDVLVPFRKNDIVEYNTSLESVYYNIRLKEEKMIVKLPPKKSGWIVKGSYAQALTSSTSGVSSTSDTTEENHYEFYYFRQMGKYFYGAVGLRGDNALYTSSTAVVYTNRFLLMGDFAFHLPRFKRWNFNIYSAIGAGFGSATSKIEGNVTKGTAMVLPYLRAGLQFPMGESEAYNLLLEGAVESVSSSEQFSGGAVQTSNATNVKGTLGLKYYFQ